MEISLKKLSDAFVAEKKLNKTNIENITDYTAD